VALSSHPYSEVVNPPPGKAEGMDVGLWAGLAVGLAAKLGTVTGPLKWYVFSGE